MVQQGNTVIRRRGHLKRLDVELPAAQYDEFYEICNRLGMTKADAISQALNIWIHMVAPQSEEPHEKG